MNEINKLPVKDLTSRYNIGRTALYTRFTAANITPEKDGTRSYISKEELEELDRLDAHLKTGGKLDEFKPTLQQNNEMIVYSTPTLDKPDNFTEALQLVEAIARHFQEQREPLQHYAALEQAACCAWILTTSEVSGLIGVKPTGDRFERGSFAFVRSGKVGAQTGWKVEKI
jgi:hypothetical protein